MTTHKNTLKLLGGLFALGLIYLGVELFGDRSRSKGFRQDLVVIDTARISRMLIESPESETELLKSDGKWHVVIGPEKTISAQPGTVRNLLQSIQSVRPSRMVTRDPGKWAEYQVDTAGTRIRIFEGQKKTLDLIIGRFGILGQRNFFSYVRLHDDDEVYTADNFMGMTIGTEPADYRNRQLLSFNSDSLETLRFHYPADSSFTAIRDASLWYIGNNPTDSTAMSDYLSDLRYISITEFVDDIEPSGLPEPLYRLQMVEQGKPPIELVAHQLPEGRWILHSGSNPENYFEGEEQISGVFVGAGYLLGLYRDN